MRTEKNERAKFDKLYITEVLNDLYRNGFVRGGKAESLLRDWAIELRKESRPVLPASRLKKVFVSTVGRNNW